MKLHEQVKDYKERSKDAIDTINELMRYLHSPKFRCGDSLDGYVNINDVIDRLRPAIDRLQP